MEGVKQRIKQILDTMDIPELRKDLNKDQNIQWLIRNIGIRNSKHPDINEVTALLCGLIWNK